MKIYRHNKIKRIYINTQIILHGYLCSTIYSLLCEESAETISDYGSHFWQEEFVKNNAWLYLWSSDTLYSLRVLLGIIHLVMVSRKPSEPASYESLSSHNSGSSKNLSITLLTRRSSGGCEKCFFIALKTLRSLTSPVL